MRLSLRSTGLTLAVSAEELLPDGEYCSRPRFLIAVMGNRTQTVQRGPLLGRRASALNSSGGVVTEPQIPAVRALIDHLAAGFAKRNVASRVAD